MNRKKKLTRLVTASLFMALTVVMTVTPYFGYISYGNIIEITTIHIAVILSAAMLGPEYGALLGGFWGLTCLLRAATNPAIYGLFLNPLISVVPRIFVGLVAGLVFRALKKTKLKQPVSLGITAAAGTLTNTVLVLTAIQLFGGMLNTYASILELVKQIFTVIISVNGLIELIAAIILVPVIYTSTQKFFNDKL